MIEFENMNQEPQKTESYFSEDLRAAITSGDTSEIKAAVELQEANPVTEAISNRLIVRNFLLKQKQGISLLDEEVSSDASNPHAIIADVQSYIGVLDNDFVDSFVTEEHSDAGKLSGDAHFRLVLSESTKSSVALARQLGALNVALLTPPDMIFEWMQNVRDSIVESAWDSVQDIREDGASARALETMHQSIAKLVASLDEYIAGSLPR